MEAGRTLRDLKWGTDTVLDIGGICTHVHVEASHRAPGGSQILIVKSWESLDTVTWCKTTATFDVGHNGPLPQLRTV